ncbi:MAG: glycosyl hydrolase family 28-related protein [Desulfobacterales bacterium]|nr:glycosyl hydrolase family 28-related protein [Desulfobacterales bacterium]MDD4393991.1 glycosyl hydrolase family 28-related protein [Desulfobacterales bacterium]
MENHHGRIGGRHGYFCSRNFRGGHESEPADTSGSKWVPAVWNDYLLNGPTEDHLPDFSRAGYQMGSRPIPDIRGPVFDATAAGFGAVPGDARDDTTAIQLAIDAAGAAGGGVVFLPAGRYDVHQTADAPFLRITHDHVILRGAGSEPSGTVLHLGAPGPGTTVRRLGTVPAEQEARHRTAVAVMGSEDRRELARYTGTVTRGQTLVNVSDTSSLVAGHPVVIEFHDPLIDVRQPDPEKVDIAVQLTHPFRLVEGQTDTFGNAARTISWIVKVEEILDSHRLRLAEAARFNQFERYKPVIYSFAGVHGVGIEHLRLESSWPGGYRHHKPFVGNDGAIVRSAKEQDYLWGGLWFSYACDGWVRNVVIKDLTQGINFSHCADVTVQDLNFQGLSGHAGITIGQSHGILVKRAHFFSRLVHPVTLTMWASGNVISDCEAHYEGRDDFSGTDAAIDFHGLFPHENLFDNLRGFYVCPGGDLSVLPHAGVRNVFWNIRVPERMECYTCEKADEFARTFDYQSTSSGTPDTMFEHLPQAFFIGLYRKGNRRVKVGDSASDRHNAWMTVEGLNRNNLAISSLYNAQRDNHCKNVVKALGSRGCREKRITPLGI